MTSSASSTSKSLEFSFRSKILPVLVNILYSFQTTVMEQPHSYARKRCNFSCRSSKTQNLVVKDNLSVDFAISYVLRDQLQYWSDNMGSRRTPEPRDASTGGGTYDHMGGKSAHPLSGSFLDIYNTLAQLLTLHSLLQY